MDELHLEDFKHGGVNITGFRLINPDDAVAKRTIETWKKLPSSSWPGAGVPYLPVRDSKYI